MWLSVPTAVLNTIDSPFNATHFVLKTDAGTGFSQLVENSPTPRLNPAQLLTLGPIFLSCGQEDPLCPSWIP